MSNTLDDKTLERLRAMQDSLLSGEGEGNKMVVDKTPKIKRSKRPGSLAENGKSFEKSKQQGALAEISKTLKRDIAVEENLGAELEKNQDFKKKTKKILERRKFVAEKAKSIIIKKSKDQFVFGEAERKAMRELEKELSDVFTRFVYEKMADQNKQILLDHLVDNPIAQDEVEIINIKNVEESYYNVIHFSTNGYLMKLINKKEVYQNKEYQVENEKALYDLIAPDGKIADHGLNYEGAMNRMLVKSKKHQAQLKKDFPEGKREIILKLLKEDQDEAAADKLSEDEFFNSFSDLGERLEPAEKPVEKDKKILKKKALSNGDELQATEENQESIIAKEIVDIKTEEPALLELVEDETPVSGTETHSLIDEENQEPLAISEEPVLLELLEDEKPTSGTETLPPVNSETEPVLKEESPKKVDKPVDKILNNDPNEPLVDHPEVIDEDVLIYANEMGIEDKELMGNKEFSSLNAEQQRFVLEALNRSSLAKIKVEAHENFEYEKSTKKWYNFGFGFNQKFHKKKHEILAAKDIHEQGLEGYGKIEFSWLINVVKDGPEIKLNDEGEVSVSYLKDEDYYSDEQKKLIASYNENAYDLINVLPGSPEYNYYKDSLNESRQAILDATEEDNGYYLVSNLVKAEKDFKLHQFLKGDPKTEKIIQDMVNNSLSGWDEVKMLIGGQKDKAAYAGIGMAARTLLKSEAVTLQMGKAFTYAVGPIVAMVIGGWRANSKAHMEIKERAYLAKMGIRNESEMAENLALAAGKVELEGKVINFGLADKLDRLTMEYDKLADKFDQANKFEPDSANIDVINEYIKDSHFEIGDEDKAVVMFELLDETGRFEIINKYKESVELEKEAAFIRLLTRVNFTEEKIDRDLVSFGDPQERGANYYKLLNSLNEAKAFLYFDNAIVAHRPGVPDVKKETKKLTRSNKFLSGDYEYKLIKNALEIDEKRSKSGKKEDKNYKKLSDIQKGNFKNRINEMSREWYSNSENVELVKELSKLSVEDRLASFLDFNEEKRKSAEAKYLFWQTTKGAVIGASAAAVGAWIMESTGLDHFIGRQFNKVSELLHVNEAISYLKGGARQAGDSLWNGLKNLVPKSSDIPAGGGQVTKNLTPISVDLNKLVPNSTDSISSDSSRVAAVKKDLVPATDTTNVKKSEDILVKRDSVSVVKKSDVISNKPAVSDSTKTEAAADSKFAAKSGASKVLETPKNNGSEIKAGGSVWESARNIFKGNAKNFGYVGDLKDGEALNRWAETKTANAFHNSGEVKNLIYEGNKVTLIPDGDNFKIEVEQGSGLEPKYVEIDDDVAEVETVSRNVEVPKTEINAPAKVEGTSIKIEDSKSNLGTKDANANIKPIDEIVDTNPTAAEEAVNKLKITGAKVSETFHLKPGGTYQMSGDKLVYSSASGKIIFDSAGKVVKEIVDASGKIVPKEFIGEMEGARRFFKQGGYDKLLATWNKLSDNDKSVYKAINIFREAAGQERSEQLINSIKRIFNLDKQDIFIDPSKKIFVVTGKHFDINHDGVTKLIKFFKR